MATDQQIREQIEATNEMIAGALEIRHNVANTIFELVEHRKKLLGRTEMGQDFDDERRVRVERASLGVLVHV